MRSQRTATKSSPRSPQLGKAQAQQRKPNAAKNQFLKKEFFLKFFTTIKFLNLIFFHMPFNFNGRLKKVPMVDYII